MYDTGAGVRFPRWVGMFWRWKTNAALIEGVSQRRIRYVAPELLDCQAEPDLLDFNPFDDFDADWRGAAEEPLDFGGAKGAIVDADVVDPAREVHAGLPIAVAAYDCIRP